MDKTPQLWTTCNVHVLSPSRVLRVESVRRTGMRPDDAFAVFRLLDHANDLMAHAGEVCDWAALDVVAAWVLAGDVAAGSASVPVELPSSVEGCLDAAVQRVLEWDTGTLAPSARALVDVLLAVDLGVGGA